MRFAAGRAKAQRLHSDVQQRSSGWDALLAPASRQNHMRPPRLGASEQGMGVARGTRFEYRGVITFWLPLPPTFFVSVDSKGT